MARQVAGEMPRDSIRGSNEGVLIWIKIGVVRVVPRHAANASASNR
jgi:hypothetical protein